MNGLPTNTFNQCLKLWQDMGAARRRRRIPVAMLAERAGILSITFSKIERGMSTVSVSAYASVLFALGLPDRFRDLVDASCDATGRVLEEERLLKRIRLSKSKGTNGGK
jgi:transcriptional regulator with XRE-family HTH domain